MLSIGFALICVVLICVCYYISHDMINIVSVFTVPYMLIIPINNLFMVHRGFYLISDQVIYLISGSLFCIFIGYILTNSYLKVHKRKNIYREQQIELKFSQYKMQGMLKYVLFAEIIVLIRLSLIILQNGIAYISNESFSGHMLRGPLGHLLLTIYPLVPILFLYWLKDKRQFPYLIATVLCVGLLFTTFVKYHVIGIAVLIYLFVSLEDRKYLHKGLIMVSAVAISAFVLNYFISFALRGIVSRVAQDYYVNHLWNYMAGSLIHDNWIFTRGTFIGLSTIWKITRAIITPLNALVSALFGVEMTTPKVVNPVGMVSVGSNGEVGNVLDTFGWFFPSKGSLPEIIFTFLFFVFIGCFFTLVYNNSMRKNNTFYITISVMLTFFCFFSFFAEFYNLLPCWEILVYSIIIPKFFDRRIKIRFRK